MMRFASCLISSRFSRRFSTLNWVSLYSIALLPSQAKQQGLYQSGGFLLIEEDSIVITDQFVSGFFVEPLRRLKLLIDKQTYCLRIHKQSSADLRHAAQPIPFASFCRVYPHSFKIDYIGRIGYHFCLEHQSSFIYPHPCPSLFYTARASLTKRFRVH